MTNVRPILDIVWDSLRRASIVDDLAIIEYSPLAWTKSSHGVGKTKKT